MNLLLDGLHFAKSKSFSVKTLPLESAALKNNPWNDPSLRFHTILQPNDANANSPVIFLLSGYGNNAPNSLAPKTFESNFYQQVESGILAGAAPNAYYVCVDAMTTWGGSQFMNSEGLGRYEDMIMSELLPAVIKHFGLLGGPNRVAVMGASSGGFGALQLASAHPDKIGYACAIAPDSLFEQCYLPHILDSIPHIQKWGGIRGVYGALKSGELKNKKYFFDLMNTVTMGLCYAANSNEVEWPVDFRTGELIPDKWALWKRWDPIEFLPARAANVKKLKNIWLSVGHLDQFRLQYGSRLIADALTKSGAELTYSEFKGNHFETSEERPKILAWLKQQWKT